MLCTKIDRRRRKEWVRMSFDVYTPKRQFRLEDTFAFRTYTADQFARLVRSVPELEVVETYDFAYRLDEPLSVDGATEDAVFVFRKR